MGDNDTLSVFDQLRLTFAAGQDAEFVDALLRYGIPAAVLALVAVAVLAAARCRVTRLMPALLALRRLDQPLTPRLRIAIVWSALLLVLSVAAAGALVLAFGSVTAKRVAPPLLGAGIATVPLAAVGLIYACARFRSSAGATAYRTLGAVASGGLCRRALKRVYSGTLGSGVPLALAFGTACITAYELAVVLSGLAVPAAPAAAAAGGGSALPWARHYSYLATCWVFLSWNYCFFVKGLYTGALGRSSDAGSFGGMSARLSVGLALEWLRVGRKPATTSSSGHGSGAGAVPAPTSSTRVDPSLLRGDAASLAALAAKSPLLAAYFAAAAAADAPEGAPVSPSAAAALRALRLWEATGWDGNDSGWAFDESVLDAVLASATSTRPEGGPTSVRASFKALAAATKRAAAAQAASARTMAALWHVLGLAVLGGLIATHLSLVPQGPRNGRSLVFVTTSAVVLVDATTVCALAGGLLSSPLAAALLAGAGRVALVVFGTDWWLLGVAAAYALVGGALARVAARRLVVALAAQGAAFAVPAAVAAEAGAGTAPHRPRRRGALGAWCGCAATHATHAASSAAPPAAGCCCAAWRVATSPPVLLTALTALFVGFVSLLAAVQASDASSLPAVPVTVGPDSGSFPTPQFTFAIVSALGVLAWGTGEVTYRAWAARGRTWTPLALGVGLGGAAVAAAAGGAAFHLSGVGLSLVLGVFAPLLALLALALHGQWRADEWALWVPAAPRRNAAFLGGAAAVLALLVGAAGTLAATTAPAWVGWVSLGCALGVAFTVVPVLQWSRTLHFSWAQPALLALALLSHALAHGLLIKFLTDENEAAGGAPCFDATPTAPLGCHIARWAAASSVGAPALLVLGLAAYKLADDGWRLSQLVAVAAAVASTVVLGVGVAITVIYRADSLIPAVLLALVCVLGAAGVLFVRYKTAGDYLSRPWRRAAGAIAAAGVVAAVAVALYQLFGPGNRSQFILWLSAAWLAAAFALCGGGLALLASTGAYRAALPPASALHMATAGAPARATAGLAGADASSRATRNPLGGAGGAAAGEEAEAGAVTPAAALRSYAAQVAVLAPEPLLRAAAAVHGLAAAGRARASALQAQHGARGGGEGAATTPAGAFTYFAPTLLPVFVFDPSVGAVVPANTGVVLLLSGLAVLLAWGLLAVVFVAPPYAGVIATCLAKVWALLFALDATLRTRAELHTACDVLLAAGGGAGAATGSGTVTPWERAWAGRLRLLDALVDALQVAVTKAHLESQATPLLLTQAGETQERAASSAAAFAAAGPLWANYYALLPARLLATRAASLVRLVVRRVLKGKVFLDLLLCLPVCRGCRCAGRRRSPAALAAAPRPGAPSAAAAVANPFRAATLGGSEHTAAPLASVHAVSPPAPPSASLAVRPTAFLVADARASVFGEAGAGLRALLTSFHTRRDFAAAFDASLAVVVVKGEGTSPAAGVGLPPATTSQLAREALGLDTAAAATALLEAQFLAQLQHEIVAAAAEVEAAASAAWVELLAWAALPSTAPLLQALRRPEVAAFCAQLTGAAAPALSGASPSDLVKQSAAAEAGTDAWGAPPAAQLQSGASVLLPPPAALASRAALLAWAAQAGGVAEAADLGADLALLEGGLHAFKAACDSRAQAQRAEEAAARRQRQEAEEAAERAAAEHERAAALAASQALRDAQAAAAAAAAEAEALRQQLEAERQRVEAALRQREAEDAEAARRRQAAAREQRAAEERARREAAEAAQRAAEERHAAEAAALRQQLEAERQRAEAARAAEEAARAEAEAARVQRAAEERARQRAEQVAAAERARQEAEQARRDAEERLRLHKEAEAKRRAAEERARRAAEEAEERAQREAEEAEERARKQAEQAAAAERARQAAEQARRDAAERARREEAARVAKDRAERLAREARQAEQAAAAAAATKADEAAARRAAAATYKTQAQLLEESNARAQARLAQLRAAAGPWTDPSWKPSMWPSKPGIKYGLERIPACTPEPQLIEDGLAVSDACQGSVGDCWLISSFGILASRPELLDRLFITRAIDPKGVYAVRLAKGGRWREIFIDDYLTVFDDRYRCIDPSKPPAERETVYGGSYKEVVDSERRAGVKRYPELLYCSSRTGRELWPSVLEKAFAAFWGGYSQLKGGSCAEALLAAIPGAVTQTIMTENAEVKREFASGALWARIKGYADARHLLGAASFGSTDGHVVEGIVQGHAFSLLRVEQVSDSNGTHQLVQLRNPWGRTEWTGKWGDADKASWTPRVKALLKYDPAASGDDGQFWMSWQDFIARYECIYVAQLFKTVQEGGKWHVYTGHGAWKGSTAAGCNEGSEANPQFYLAPTTKCKVLIQQEQISHSIERKTIKSHGLRVVKNGGKRCGNLFYKGELLSSTCEGEADLNVELTLEPTPDGKPYVLHCFMLKRGDEADFVLRVYSDAPLSGQWHPDGKLQPLP